MSIIHKVIGGEHFLYWENRPIPTKIVKTAQKFLTHDYFPLKKDVKDKVSIKLAELNNRLDASVSLDQILTLRTIMLQDKFIRYDNHRLKKLESVLRSSLGKRSLLEMAKEYNLPPVSIIRLLGIKDNKEYDLACKNDALFGQSQDKIKQESQLFERRLQKLFKKFKIEFKDEELLAAEQRKKYGRPVSTPDMLFTEPVFINGQRIYWMDAKNYLGTDISFIHKSNLKQAAKYNKLWGPGAFCFRNSYIYELTIPGTMLLDGSSV